MRDQAKSSVPVAADELAPSPPGRLPKGRCITGKRPYYKERLANRAITEAAKRGELPQLRHYQCPECGWWHLSRKRRPPRPP